MKNDKTTRKQGKIPENLNLKLFSQEKQRPRMILSWYWTYIGIFTRFFFHGKSILNGAFHNWRSGLVVKLWQVTGATDGFLAASVYCVNSEPGSEIFWRSERDSLSKSGVQIILWTHCECAYWLKTRYVNSDFCWTKRVQYHQKSVRWSFFMIQTEYGWYRLVSVGIGWGIRGSCLYTFKHMQKQGSSCMSGVKGTPKRHTKEKESEALAKTDGPYSFILRDILVA